MSPKHKPRSLIKLLCLSAILCSMMQAVSNLSHAFKDQEQQLFKDRQLRNTNDQQPTTNDQRTKTKDQHGDHDKTNIGQIMHMEAHVKQLESNMEILKTKLEAQDAFLEESGKLRDKRLSAMYTNMAELELENAYTKVLLHQQEKVIEELRRIPAGDRPNAPTADLPKQHPALRQTKDSQVSSTEKLLSSMGGYLLDQEQHSKEESNKLAVSPGPRTDATSSPKLQEAVKERRLQKARQKQMDDVRKQLEDPCHQVSTTNPQNRPTPKPMSPYAYVFMVGGAIPEEFKSYRGYLYNILIAAKILRDQGSTADIVVWVQVSIKSCLTTLPAEHERWLYGAGIHVRYMPKSKIESFQEVMMEKFRILSMTEYRRVLFLDSDLMPLGNLDYFFELSDGPNAILKENLIIAGGNVPMCGGFFMLAPKEGDYARAQQIIHEKYLDAYKQDTLHDVVKGWGHEIVEPDCWTGKYPQHGTRGTNWTWYGADVDQGFGYHWPKYEKKSVTIVLNHRFENWGADAEGNAVMESWVGDDPFNKKYGKPIIHDKGACDKYLCDHYHFDAKTKPWMVGPPTDVDYTNDRHVEETSKNGPYHVWFSILYTINQEHSMGVNFTHWEKIPLMSFAFDWKHGMRMMNTQAAVRAGLVEEEELVQLIIS